MSDIQREIREVLAAATPEPWKLKQTRSKNIIHGPNIDWIRSHSTDDIRDLEIKNSDIGKRETADANLIANALTWLTHQQQQIESQAKEIERLETKYHNDMNNYRNNVQTWQEEHDRQIIKQSKQLELAGKALEDISECGTTGEDARDMHRIVEYTQAEMSRLSKGESQ